MSPKGASASLLEGNHLRTILEDKPAAFLRGIKINGLDTVGTKNERKVTFTAGEAPLSPSVQSISQDSALRFKYP